jgi:OPA family glycerol-3-phosphate transporter-like MFS transporter
MRADPPGRGRIVSAHHVTIALLTTGYAGYYLCRSNLSVTLPLLIDDLAGRGMTPADARIRLGTVASLGVFAYAVGKICLGGMADFFGGRRTFLTGMGGAAAFTVVLSLAGGLPLFTLAWIGNRLVQSMGWAGVVKVASHWFSYSAYGTVMGIVSLSYLFGDAVARAAMGVLIGWGYGWPAIFRAAAAALLVLFVANWVWLRESRTDLGHAPPAVHPDNLYGGAAAGTRGVRALLRPLARSAAFWVVCALSLGCTLVRETFNTWTPTYFHAAVGYSPATAAQMSALFPLIGGVSVIVAGIAGDRLGARGRETIIVCGLALTTVALLLLAWAPGGESRAVPVALVTLVAFALIGPYSFLGGALALDFGGRHGSATASGIIDGVGYLGGVLAGDSIARISVAWGWSGAFLALGGVSALSTVAAFVLVALRTR